MTMVVAEQNKLDAFDQRCLRRIVSRSRQQRSSPTFVTVPSSFLARQTQTSASIWTSSEKAPSSHGHAVLCRL